jgi:superfamily I DNA/RNA helicase
VKSKIKKLGVNEDACVIKHIDALLEELAKKYGIKQSGWNVLDYINVGRGRNKSQEIWETIVINSLTGFSSDFLYQEYLDVIVYNNITSLEMYLHQPRIGRTKSLSIKQRKEIWELVQQYINTKEQGHYYDRSELYNLVASYLKEHDEHPFSHIIADEIQDFSNPELRFLRALVPEYPNDLFMVGDPYQRIYNNRQINFGKVGINVRGKRSRRLKVNYRTTEEIKRQAVSIVQGCTYDDFDGETENLNGYVSLMHGPKPEYILYGSTNEEHNGVLDFIAECHNNGIAYADIAIACRRRDELKEIQSTLHINNIPYQNIDSNSSSDKSGVVLSTLHNMKGLEFKVVVITGINKNTFPYKPYNWSEMSKKEQTNYQMNQRSLMYVAITRAMLMVRITGVGDRSELL